MVLHIIKKKKNNLYIKVTGFTLVIVRYAVNRQFRSESSEPKQLNRTVTVSTETDLSEHDVSLWEARLPKLVLTSQPLGSGCSTRSMRREPSLRE